MVTPMFIPRSANAKPCHIVGMRDRGMRDEIPPWKVARRDAGLGGYFVLHSLSSIPKRGSLMGYVLNGRQYAVVAVACGFLLKPISIPG